MPRMGDSVSIPRRYAKNLPAGQLSFPVYFVSIPRRYAKNIKVRCSLRVHLMFQSLVGTLKTEMPEGLSGTKSCFNPS